MEEMQAIKEDDLSESEPERIKDLDLESLYQELGALIRKYKMMTAISTIFL